MEEGWASSFLMSVETQHTIGWDENKILKFWEISQNLSSKEVSHYLWTYFFLQWSSLGWEYPIILSHQGTAFVAHQLAVSWLWSLNASRVSLESSFRWKEHSSQVPQLTLVGKYDLRIRPHIYILLESHAVCCRLVWQALSLPSWQDQRAGRF